MKVEEFVERGYILSSAALGVRSLICFDLQVVEMTSRVTRREPQPKIP